MIQILNLSKQFRLYARPRDRVWEWLGLGPKHQAFWALREINLEVPRGRALGVIGANGSGKSTLLKIITGTLEPTSGEARVEGRVAALLELGAGFHPDFTGRQNIWINGQLLGLSPGEIAAREKEIIHFSELGPFIDQPLRAYSSGMLARLGFSVAAAVNPEVLIIDEALAVGDAHFSQKCIRRIRQFREAGVTILFVSHDAGAVLALCEEAALLDAGRLIDRGRPESVLEHYNALIAQKGENNVEMTVHFVARGDADTGLPPAQRAGTFQALVSGVRWVNPATGQPLECLVSGARARLEIEVLFFAAIQSPTVGFLIRDRFGQDLFGSNTRRMGLELGDFAPGDRLRLNVEMEMNLGYGDYSLTTAVHRDDTHLAECFDWTDRLAVFHVAEAPGAQAYGLARLRPSMDFTRETSSEAERSRALGALFGQLPPALTAEPGQGPSPFLHGFYPPERDAAGRWFRWTAGEAGFVARGAPGMRLVITAAAWGRAAEAAPVKISLAVFERALGERTLAPGGEARLEWTLPAEISPGAALFRLRVEPPFAEDQREAGRTGRTLGVALLEIETQDSS